MSNINDYILWRGDIPINEQFKFNEVDSMILARFSYLRFDIIQMEKNETIETISMKMKNLSNDEFHYNGDKELITNLGQSKRFKDMIISDYIKTNDIETEKQFGAITIHISEKEMYISFIGTDSTINGWKEDFNMAFMDNVPCQLSGKNYVEEISKKYPNKYIRIGGHSKGGNVAVYSAITAKEEIKNRIIKVDNFDGPGFNKKFIDEYKNEKILDKIETYIPQDSIIGRILEHQEKTTVSLSVEKGILQHDIYSWQVLRDEMIKSEKNTKTSENITDWLKTTTTEQRKIFIDSVFELFFSTDATTFGDIKNSLTTSMVKIFKSYSKLNEEDRKVMTEMIKIFASSYLNVIKERGTVNLDNKKLEFSEKYFNKFKKN